MPRPSAFAKNIYSLSKKIQYLTKQQYAVLVKNLTFRAETPSNSPPPPRDSPCDRKIRAPEGRARPGDGPSRLEINDASTVRGLRGVDQGPDFRSEGDRSGWKGRALARWWRRGVAAREESEEEMSLSMDEKRKGFWREEEEDRRECKFAEILQMEMELELGSGDGKAFL